MAILLKPHITEKTSRETESRNVYTFIVDKNANKIQIKEAIADTYGVEVQSLRTSVVPAKARQRFTKAGMLKGRTVSYKKAVVQIAEGDTIDFYSNI